MEDAKQRWVDELHSVLWDFRTTPGAATGETPFNLTSGTKALILAEIKEPSGRVLYYDKEKNDEARRKDLDLDEIREDERV